MLIRAARKQDVSTIHRMIRQEQLDPTTRKWQNFLVAEHEGQVVGIGQIKLYPDCQELGSLAVLPAYRKSGVGAALIAALEAKAQRPLYLMCASQMQSYYERFGYQVIGWRETPRTLRLKRLAALPFRLFGVRVLAMRKT